MCAKPRNARLPAEEGMALVIALLALCITSVIGLYMVLNATVEVRISSNDEARMRARAAAEAGINHARTLLKGLDFDLLLKGPDGNYDSNPSYLSQARTYEFRNPLPWTTARLVSVADPSGDVAGTVDDGLINTGQYGAGAGVPLIPLNGIAFTANNPNGSGTATLSRYFVRISDNNGEATEIDRDADDNPFHDGDGIVIVRSMGVARTIREGSGSGARANAVVVYEARFQLQRQFDLPAAVVMEGEKVKMKIEGKNFHINGGPKELGIATLNPMEIDDNPDVDDDYDDTEDKDLVEGLIHEHLNKDQVGRVQGRGLVPSVRDATASVNADPGQSKLLDPAFLWDFVTNQVPGFADSTFTGKQNWDDHNAPDLGSYDINKSPADPSQRPRVTFVDGALRMKGNITGGGLLVVKGKLTIEGNAQFNGLVLVLGKGKVKLKTEGGINGAIYQIGLKQDKKGRFKFQKPNMKIDGQTSIAYNGDAVRAGLVLMPVRQPSIREIKQAMDQ